jgi:hypothetical protein
LICTDFIKGVVTKNKVYSREETQKKLKEPLDCFAEKHYQK